MGIKPKQIEPPSGIPLVKVILKSRFTYPSLKKYEYPDQVFLNLLPVTLPYLEIVRHSVVTLLLELPPPPSLVSACSSPSPSVITVFLQLNLYVTAYYSKLMHSEEVWTND
jgi:hypothetical protein